MFSKILILLGVVAGVVPTLCAQNCRKVPGSAGYPTNAQWQALGESVSGRLVRAIPSGEYCRQNNCTDAEWASANWRNGIPGAMYLVNFEQDYDSNPPSLCERTTPEKCGQGNVPLRAILVESVEDIQAGVNFAREHNLRLSVKASGHDILGRSTAKNSLLIHTQRLQSIAFTDNFYAGGYNQGSAVTVGSGVGLSTLYNASREDMFKAAGIPYYLLYFGLAADNVLEYNIVTADGVLRRANEIESSDLFWALRGGGAGSWGVIVNATFRTYPTFNATQSIVLINANDATTIGAICEAHANHIFDLDSMHLGQYFGIDYTGDNTTYTIGISSNFPNATSEQAVAALAPLLNDIFKAGGVLLLNTTTTSNINELLATNDDEAGLFDVMGSRLIPASTYRESPEAIGETCKRLVDAGTALIVSNVVAGGKVAENAGLHNSVLPAWRTTKVHMTIGNPIPEQGTIEEVHTAERMFKTIQLPILEAIQGPVPGAYGNEADPLEEDWQTVFYGSNYPRLSSIKAKYDPEDLFIVKTGVGSERWDAYGLCRV